MHAYYLLFWRIQKHRAEKMIMLILLNRTKKNLTQYLNQACGDEWIRTTDSRIFSPMLYQLSYITIV